MSYNAATLRQMQGEALINNLHSAYRILKQKENYEDAVDQQYYYLSHLQERKKGWLLAQTMLHPSSWMVISAGILSAVVLLFYLLAEKNDFLIPVLLCPLLALGLLQGLPFLLKKIALSLKKILHRKAGYKQATLLLVAIILLSWFFGGIKAFGLTFVLFELLGIYVATAYLDIKFISTQKRTEAMEEHFQSEERAAEHELVLRNSQLSQYLVSNEMQFMQAAVPTAFQEIEALGELIRLMDNRGIFNLSEGIAVYYEQKRINEQMALEHARLREMQEQTKLQNIQNSIAERQADDQRHHNRDMREKQDRTNEVLDDMYREQKEHNKKMEDIWRWG